MAAEVVLFLAGAAVFAAVSVAVPLGLRASARQREHDLAARREASLVRRRQAYLASQLPPVQRARVGLHVVLGAEAAVARVEAAPRSRVVSPLRRGRPTGE